MSKPDLLEVLRSYDIEATEGRVEQLLLCVAHPEDQPSMSVNLNKGLVHCHACGFRGDSLNIIMEREHLGYPAALEYAASRFGFVPDVPARRGRVGLSGESRPARGGFRPTFRRGLD